MATARDKGLAEAQKHEALARLGAARRERLDDLDYEVYLEALEKWQAETVKEACRRLAVTPRGEFEPAFPTLGTVLEVCCTVASELHMRKALNAPKREDEPPIPPEKFQSFLQQIRAAIGRRSMP